MQNNFFEYQDVPKVDRSLIGLSTTAALQDGSNIEQLKVGVQPYEYASFEKDAYITSKPKTLAKSTDLFGFLTDNVSDSNGKISVNIQVDLPNSYTISGLTLGCINKLSLVDITYYDSENSQIRSEIFSEENITDKLQFFNMASEGVKKISIDIKGTSEPYRFVGLYRIDLGAIRIFDYSNIVKATVDSYYNKLGDTLEYDVLNATIFHEEDTEYLFLKKQPILYKDKNNQTINKFYVETSESNNNFKITIKAYDEISNLEDKFMGGIYGFPDVYTGEKRPPYPYNQLIKDIIGDSGVEYEVVGTDDISVTGFLPISTRREALVTLLQGTNTRCYKRNGKLIFKPIELTETIEYGDAEICLDPTVEKSQKIGKLTFTEHTYKKGTDEVELFNWYLQQGENTGQIIEFPEPVWKVVPYEVTGTDPDTGMDIVSETDSHNVIFEVLPQDEGNETVCNYVEIKSCHTSNKVVLIGWTIIDNGNEIEINKSSKDVNAGYKEIVVDDVTVVSDAKEVAKTLFVLNSQAVKQKFKVLDVDQISAGGKVSTSLIENPLEISMIDEDGNIETITALPKIISVKDSLSGVYEVVAE